MSFDEWTKVASILGAVGSSIWGVHQWKEKSAIELSVRREEAAKLTETRRIEATKPFLDRQLSLYSEATRVVAKVANLGNTSEGKVAQARFWELYWGELAMVENPEVESAMKRMGDALRSSSR